MLDDRIDTDRTAGLILDESRIAREASAGFWPGRTVADYLDDVLAARPEEEYLTAYRADQAAPESLSYSDLAQRVSRIAANLMRLGVGRGRPGVR